MNVVGTHRKYMNSENLFTLNSFQPEIVNTDIIVNDITMESVMSTHMTKD